MIHKSNNYDTADCYDSMKLPCLDPTMCLNPEHLIDPSEQPRMFTDQFLNEVRAEMVKYELDPETMEYKLRSKLETSHIEKEPFSLTEIPLESLMHVGRIFSEGHSKYGRANWRNGVFDKAFQVERCNHALKHLLIASQFLETGEYLGSELSFLSDLAKVAWFCLIEIELIRLETKKEN